MQNIFTGSTQNAHFHIKVSGEKIQQGFMLFVFPLTIYIFFNSKNISVVAD